jgi:hypothetical protein
MATFKNFQTGTLDPVGMDGTFEDFTGAATYIGHLEDVSITLKLNTAAQADTTAAVTLQYSQDGSNWAATPASSACTYAAPSKTFVPTGRVNYVRLLCSAMADTDALCEAAYAGWNSSNRPVRSATLGSLGSQTAGTAVDVSDLEKIIVTVANAGTGVVKVQCSYNGSDWLNLATFTNTNGSVLIPAPFKLIRCNKTSHSSGTAYCYFAGVHAAGEQRFGTLGDFTSATTGTSVDVSDASRIDVLAEWVASGTFAGTGTVVIEQSNDGSTWALAPGSSSITGSGSLAITSPCRLLRARCSSFTVGTLKLRFGVVDNDLVG